MHKVLYRSQGNLLDTSLIDAGIHGSAASLMWLVVHSAYIAAWHYPHGGQSSALRCGRPVSF